ncbi:MAG: ABC transporter permease [Enterocloster asparagiformis]|nr:ABC transporter permease [Enterocloster asparagiformis]
MIRYVIKRLLLLIPIMLGVSFLVFAILNIVPGDPARVILGEAATADEVAQLNHELGYDQPFVTRYVTFLVGVVTRFDFGTSYRTGAPVIQDVLARIPTSITVAVWSIIGAVIIGVPLGILSAVKQYSLTDNVSRFVGIFLASVPPFWLGMLLIFFFSLNLRVLPTSGVSSWKGYILPSLALAIPYASAMLRFTRSAMLETIRQEYVKTARAKGVPEMWVIISHALKNAALPVITIVGTSFGGLLGGAVVTESVFSLPGLGTLLVMGIRTKDIPVVMGATIFYALMFGTIMLLVDLLYAFADPRIKAKYK